MPERYEFINHFINKYDYKNPEYLEIGVHNGDTFRNINSNKKDGVDPEQYCPCSFVNYKITSDDFFKNHIKKKYDIIFIDGLHTAYQVSKDIYNSLNYLKKGGIIILDDVYPHSEKEQEALNLDKLGPNTGDVWKCVYNILDTLILISEHIYFCPDSERGLLIFKVKEDNLLNITIEDTIPTKNVDGFYKGDDKEWSKYTYKKDFKTYFDLLLKYKYTI